MKNNKKIIIIVILAMVGVGYYFYLSNKPSSTTEKVVKTSKLDDILTEDISSVTNTPKSTVKFYSEILNYLYNEGPDEEQITELGKKAREVMDIELIENNPEETYFVELDTDVSEYAQARRIIMGYAIDSSDEVEYYTEENREYAVVNATYTLRESDTFTKANEEYILRKDEEGYWKILGWRIAEQAVTEDQNNNE